MNIHHLTDKIRKNIILFLLLLQALTAISQSKIYGTVIDSDQKTVANANVLLLNFSDSSLVKGMISSTSGMFTFENIAKGKYIINSTFTGFDRSFTPAFVINDDRESLNLGRITLAQKTSELNAVTVTGKKPLYQQLIDRTVINVENSITAAGSTALDVLARSPGVMVNYQDNTISMNGKSGVVLMINGKPNYMPVSAIVQMLSGMSADNIEKIELITTPPANFDAEGNAGYINIVLKTNNNVGTNGAFSIMAGYGSKFQTSGNINFNHRKGRTNIYGDASYTRRYTRNFMNFSRRVSNNDKLIETFSNSDRDVVIPNFNGRLGIDYQLSNKTVMGILLTAFDNKYIMTALNENRVLTNNSVDSTIRIINVETNHWMNYSANINLQHNFKEDASLTVNVDYIHFDNNQPVDYGNRYFNGSGAFMYEVETRSRKTTPISFWVGALDLSKKLNPKLSIDAGIKGTLSKFRNDISFATLKGNSWIRENNLSSIYTLNENYSAAYASLNATVNKKTEAKMGVRYEYTNSNLGTDTQKDIVDRHYGNLFPSVFISHKLNKKNSINLSYSRRITRPTFNDLAPFTYYIDPNTLISGNSALQPSYTNTFKADYNFKNYFLSVSYSKEDASIQAFQPDIDSVTNKQILSAKNIANKKTFSTVLSIPVTVNNWWAMQFNLTGTWQESNASYKGDAVKIRKTTFSINGNQRFTFPKNWSAEISGFYQSADLFGIFIQQPFSSLDLGIKKKLKDNKSSFQFAVANILESMNFDFIADVPSQNIYSDVHITFFYRTYRLTYSRNFGKQKLKDQRARTTGSEEEKERVRSQ